MSGGAYTVVTHLIASSLSINPNIKIDIVSFGEEDKTIIMDGYTVHLVKSKFFPTSKFWYSHVSLKNKIIEINPDVVHLHFTYPPYSLLTTLPFPIVITAHGLTTTLLKLGLSYPKKNYFSFMLETFYEKKALNKANSIIAVSEWIKTEIIDIIGPNFKVVYIPNGINATFDEINNMPNNLSCHVSHPIIFYAGRLIKIKNVSMLIKSLYDVKKKMPSIHLCIAGDGPQLTNLQKLVDKLDLCDNVHFLGFLPNDELKKFMLASDVFVLPSKIENCPCVILEALEAGTPVIASNVGGIPDILGYGEYGILFNPEDVQDLTKSIVSLLSDSKLQKELSEKGIRRVQEYLWDDIAKETLDLYSSLVNQ